MSFAFLPHTADLRAEVHADSIEGLYQSAADLMRHIVVGESPVAGSAQRGVDLASATEDERFFRFVRELVYLFDAEGFLPARVTLDGGRARVSGEVFDAEHHLAERQIKAVTRHGFCFEQDRDGLRAELVFDL